MPNAHFLRAPHVATADAPVRRDHGGDLDAAMAHFGGAAQDWIDLSTGINACPYPVPPVPEAAWTRLPTRADMARLAAAAAAAYGTTAPLVPLAGAQAAIQLVPLLDSPGEAAVLAPTYNEHRAALEARGWRVREATHVRDLAGADLAVVVNPNNPDGRLHAPADLLALGEKVGRLVVDESFMDMTPEASLAAYAARRGLIVLRSFGKFYGIAGLRLGFALGSGPDIDRLADLAGPWPVSGAAIAIGCRALEDRVWARETATRLKAEALRLDRLATSAGWRCAGGTDLFRLYEVPDAVAARAHLARAAIWVRIFPWSRTLVRLGLPGRAAHWARLAAALERRAE
ncbi:threonine-phosphate decarboxylase [Aquabacter sp. L1I39]|uniref:threonine-phosphate decarboxylase CobD n=1 Tax=Aquabacter sp. L1I39 TaxID=2820278 RepID=UPI001AD953BD|nr:threonine-phosphate decarboxylase CobD [Aquabacter sp. L1I39]QTL05597.1 threonine-phosphate decarboxylase [Aquabacter sp. L1I39]